MSLDLLKLGLDIQAAILGKGPLAKPAPDYRPPFEKVCPSCGRKHTGYFETCTSCQSKE